MSTALAKLTSSMAAKLNIEGNAQELMQTLKATAFKGSVSDAQMTALMLVAQQYGLNPFTKEIYAFPDKQNGIVPVVGVDGWAHIINDHPQFDGMDFGQDDESCTCSIYRKDRSRPITITEYASECKRNSGPWQSHPKRMLRHKAMIQCARLAFGYSGIYDPDEAESFIEKTTPFEIKSVTDGQNDAYQQYEDEVLPKLLDAANSSTDALTYCFKHIGTCDHKKTLWTKHATMLKQLASEADSKVIGESEHDAAA